MMIGKTFLLICASALVTVNAGYDDPSQAPSICAAPESDGILVAHEDCDKFNKCYQGTPAVIDCPPGLVYNPDREYCDWPYNVDCGDRIIDNEGEVNNNNGNNGNSDPSEAGRICAAENSDGILVAHKDCDKFNKCYQGTPAVIDCPAGLVYNPDREYCDWPYNVDCGDRIVDNEGEVNNNNGNNGNSDPSEAGRICAAENSDGILVAHEDCDKLYKCSESAPVALDCPPGLLYNPDKEFCDWPENVDCSNRDKETEVDNNNSSDNNSNDVNDNSSGDSGSDNGNDAAGEADRICFEHGSDGNLVAHENCNKFYICVNGDKVAFDCASDLVYNPIEKYCDWPVNVDCGNRIIS